MLPDRRNTAEDDDYTAHPARPDLPGADNVAELIISSLKDGLIYLDDTGLVSRINPVMERLLGVSAADAVGRSVKELTGDPEICLLITLKAGRTTDTFRHKGREFEVESIEVADEAGERAGTVTIFRDVTDLKMLERQRNEVMSMITHDLKAPLTAITGHADLILEGALGEISQDIRESVEAMARGSEKILTIINDFLTVSKLQAGQMKPSFERSRIESIVEEALYSQEPEARRRGRTITLALAPVLPELECDPAQVERVISNLVNNAIKFTLNGGRIKLGAAPAGPERVKELTGEDTAPEAGYVEIFVEDDGVGIPEEEQPYLFDRYWRGIGAGRVKGTGLGLAIVKRIVEAHHGLVGVSSEKGKGSRFHVLLPVNQPTPK